MTGTTTIKFWLGLAAAVIALVLPAAARASINVVYNPGFEQGGCGATNSPICGWVSSGSGLMFQWPGGESANSIMRFASQCGTIGCYGSGSEFFSASTDPAFCAAISPGTHPASFSASWDGGLSLEPGSAWLSAAFYQGSDCTGQLGGDSIGGSGGEQTGVLVAPAGTQSALFQLSAEVPWSCDDYCAGASAYFDDVYVEDALLSDTTPPGTSLTSWPFGGVSNSTSARFAFVASEPATFECSLDGTPLAACTSPVSYADLADGSHTFRVRATDMAGNVEPTPAGVTWTVDTRPLAITSVTPTSGPPGVSVSITGTGFIGVRSVSFNGASGLAGSFTVNSPTSITALVPKEATTGLIAVQTASGTATSSSPFTVTCEPPGPTIESFSPTSGPPGTSVTITGTGFADLTHVEFSGSTPDAQFGINSATSVTATVPNAAGTGPIRVETYTTACTSSSPFTVTSPPTVSSFTPTSGPVGTSVSISGTNFSGASSVTFNGTAASYTVNSPTSITAWVPSGATSGPISVTVPNWTATSAGSFTVVPPPKITNFTPTSGQTGQKVTITGSNFGGVSKVELGTIAAAFTVNSSTKVTATVPSIAHGDYKWSVTTPGGTATSTTDFHVR